MGLRAAALSTKISQLRAARPDLVAELEAEQQRMADIRAVLITGPYPGLGTGDIDYYKAFSWRDWNTLRDGGRMGVVFPRSLLNAAGSAAWRDRVLTSGQISSAVFLTNTNKWVFDEVHGQYTVVLLSLVKASPGENAQVGIAGPFHSLADFNRGATSIGHLPVAALTEWGNRSSFPLLPDTQAVEVFTKYRQHPRFDASGGDWEYKLVAEFHATNDRKTFDAGGYRQGRWPVLTGGSFNLWDPDAGEPYAWASPKKVTTALQTRRNRQARTASSAFYGLSASETAHPETLPCMRPRIAFRDVARSTDTRTVLAALVPPNTVLTNKAPYLLSRRGDERDEAYLLGVLSSIPFDWYARRYVEISLNFHILNAFPVPRPDPEKSPLRARVVEIAGRLAAVDQRYGDWAAKVGVSIGPVPDAHKDDLIAELDAVVALLYGLTQQDLVHIFETFHRGWDYKPRLAAVLTHFEAWKAQVPA